MIGFHDYDPANPFDVVGEKHIICNQAITLDYAPLKGSVSIAGLSEDTTGTVPQGTFFVNYDEENNYQAADQKVHFPAGYDGVVVTVDYKGVSTLLRAEHMNEIKSFIERGASELAARIIAEHEQNTMDAIDEHCGHIVSALREIAEAITAQGGAGSGTIQFASDEEADELLDEYFPGSDVEEVGYPSVFASDEEAEALIDEYLPLPSSGGESQSETVDAATGSGEDDSGD